MRIGVLAHGPGALREHVERWRSVAPLRIVRECQSNPGWHWSASLFALVPERLPGQAVAEHLAPEGRAADAKQRGGAPEMAGGLASGAQDGVTLAEAVMLLQTGRRRWSEGRRAEGDGLREILNMSHPGFNA